MPGAAKEVRLYRGLLLFVGAIYLLWWLAVDAILPHAFNPFLGRALLVLLFWGIVAASFFSERIRDHLRLLWACSLWLLTAHYYYLFYENGGDINWVVGSFVTVSAISLGLLSGASLLAYSVFAGLLSLGLVVLIPDLRQSVFLPGLLTVLLQANIGLQSRLKVIRNLAVSNEHFQLLFNSAFEGILIHEEARIVQVNEALVGMLGFAAADLLGRSVLDLVHPDERAAVAEKMQHEVMAPLQTRAVRSDGTVIDIEVRGKPFTHGTRASRLLTLQDVSERKQQATALRRSNEALERSNIDLQRFASVASHDLQTPLRSIASFLDLLQSTYEQKLDAQGRDWLLRASRSAKQLQILIQDLLDYARVEARARLFAIVSMREVLERATSLLDAAIHEANAEITSGDLPDVTGDASQLDQLLMNLVGNAIKYRGNASPRVHVTAEDKGEEWLFAVRDNGIGIAEQHHQRIFEIFKRLHDTKEYPGTGIGLAVCRRVVGHHGGRIWVASESGKGSVFYFTIAKGTVSPS
jgi:PAS domain S-box-containing protein